MKILIPEIGTKLILDKDWTFTLFPERRNYDLAYFNGYSVVYYDRKDGFVDNDTKLEAEELYNKLDRGDITHSEYDNEKHQLLCDRITELIITLPKGTELVVDRIYIRKGASGFSSISFRANNLGESIQRSSAWNKKLVKKKSFRFWAKLDDVNQIEFNLKSK